MWRLLPLLIVGSGACASSGPDPFLASEERLRALAFFVENRVDGDVVVTLLGRDARVELGPMRGRGRS